jgi:hypothetical protein
MGGNYPWFQLTDVTTKDTTVRSGESAELTVHFTCDGDLLAEWFRGDFEPAPPPGGPPPFGYEVKVYLEGMGKRPEINVRPAHGELKKLTAHYTETVTTPPLTKEGVYEVAALVEISHSAGFVMGHYDGDLKISVWTPA